MLMVKCSVGFRALEWGLRLGRVGFQVSKMLGVQVVSLGSRHGDRTP